MLNRGRKTKRWDAVRRQLKREFERNGITRCERCNAGYPLSFAHRYKRRLITTDEELRTCALLCIPCHEAIEFAGHEVMYQAITKLIENR